VTDADLLAALRRVGSDAEDPDVVVAELYPLIRDPRQEGLIVVGHRLGLRRSGHIGYDRLVGFGAAEAWRPGRRMALFSYRA
jgi:hypothetical protein